MKAYDGGAGPVDSSGWKQPVSSVTKDGEPVPPPAKSTLGVRESTPDPYTDDNPHVRRNFGR